MITMIKEIKSGLKINLWRLILIIINYIFLKNDSFYK